MISDRTARRALPTTSLFFYLMYHMRTHRFFLPTWNEQSDYQITDEALLHQWLRVFRMKVGDELILCDGQNKEARATLLDIQKKSVTVRIGKKRSCETELPRSIILAAALLKRENFEWVAQKATELGVTEIQPLLTERTVKEDLKRTRVEVIVKEAMEQSGRGVIPIVHNPKPIEEMLEVIPASSCLIFDAEGAEPLAVLPTINAEPVVILVGPEGGWSDRERDLFKKYSIPFVRLGARVLRAETAAIAALALVTTTIEAVA